MVEVRLHGSLAARFGRVWNLDINSPREAVAAIECGRPGFRKAIAELDRMGMVFRVRTPMHDFVSEEVGMSVGRAQRIDIIPIVRGASAGLRFVVGAALIFFSYGSAAPWAAPMMGIGVSLTLGAITEWLTPTLKKEDVAKNVQSWTLSGPTNTMDQGSPVPIIYGEVLTGSTPISGGLSVSDMTASGSVAPGVVISGNSNPVFGSGASGLYTLVVNLSASAMNFVEPYTWAWTVVSGFAGATAVRLFNNNVATCRLELDYDISGVSVDTGTLNCAMTGKDTPSESTIVGYNASQLVTVNIDGRPYVDSTGGL